MQDMQKKIILFFMVGIHTTFNLLYRVNRESIRRKIII